MTDITALIAEGRGFAEGSTSARATLLRDLADALAAESKRADDAEREMHARELHHFETEQQLADLTAEVTRLRAEWDGEREVTEAVRSERDALAAVIEQAKAATRLPAPVGAWSYLSHVDLILLSADTASVLATHDARIIREFAERVRARWAPDTCPWVGALDDEAERIEREAGA